MQTRTKSFDVEIIGTAIIATHKTTGRIRHLQAVGHYDLDNGHAHRDRADWEDFLNGR